MTPKSRLLRRRLHAHLSRPDVSGRGVSHALRAPRRRCRSGAVRDRLSRGRPGSWQTMRRSSSTHPQVFIDFTNAVIRGMGGDGAGVGRGLARSSTTSGPRASTSRSMTTCRACCNTLRDAGILVGTDLQHSPLPRVVSKPLRARRPDLRGRLVVRARVHETAPQHLRGGA